MATKKETGKQKEELNTNLLWRKPITLDDDEGDDPLAPLYGGSKISEQATESLPDFQEGKRAVTNDTEEKQKRPVKPRTLKEIIEKSIKPEAEEVKEGEIEGEVLRGKIDSAFKLTASELKGILRIKSENFTFTDIREILRGKSLDMYAYLRYLAGEAGVCKIKHGDLMKRLDISRPTLFKQADWLTRLSLIEKQNVPGDHFGTSYIVFPLEKVLPVQLNLIKQLETYIKNFDE